MEELLSIRGYAKRRGCYPSYIGRLAKMGKIPLTDGKIDPVLADAALAKNTAPRAKTKKPAIVESNLSGSSDGEAPLVYSAELARLTKEKADAAELENKVRRGELVNRREFERKSLAFDDLMKRRIEALPTKLTPSLANQPARQVFARLEVEVREMLTEFASIKDEEIDAHVGELFPEAK